MWIPRSLACLLLATATAASAIPIKAAESEKKLDVALPKKDFEGDLKGTKVVLFGASSCESCTEAGEIFLQGANIALTAEKSSAASHIDWVKIDCDKRGALCVQFKIEELPTIAAVSNEKLVGAVSNWKVLSPKQLAENLANVLSTGAVLNGPGLASIPEDVDVKVENTDEKDVTFEDSNDSSASASASSVATAQASTTRKLAPPSRVKAKAEDDKKADDKKADEKRADGKQTDSNEEEEEVSPIEALTGKTYNEEHMKGLWIVKYFSPYCPHCVHFAPVYVDIFNQLGGDEGLAKMGVHMSDVNCVEEGDICGKAGISGIPAIFAFSDGKKVAQFEGDRNIKDIIDWIEKLAAGHGKANGAKANDEVHDIKAALANLKDAEDSTKPDAKKADSGKAPVKEEKSKAEVASSQIASWSQFKASYSTGKSKILTPKDYKSLVAASSEPWMIKFFSPGCPHCVNMAPKWEQFASDVKGHINVGEIDCFEHTEFCLDLGIKQYPTLRFVRGSSHSVDYDSTKGYFANKFEEFARKQSARQLLPINSAEEFQRIVTSNNNRYISTFVYFHDEAVVSEDLAALGKINDKVADLRAVVYACDSQAVRDLCGIKHALTGLTMIQWLDTESGKPNVFAIRNGFIPEVFRDVKKSVNWIKTMRLSSLQLVTAKTIKDALDYGKYAVIYVLDQGHQTIDAVAEKNTIKAINGIAAQLAKVDLDRQKDTQSEFRSSKKKAMDILAELGQFDAVRDVYSTKIDIQPVIDVAFVMGTLDDLTAGLKKSLDMSKFQPGDIIVADFRAGKYATENNKEKISNADQMLNALMDWEKSPNGLKKKTFRAMKGMRSWDIPGNQIDVSRFVSSNSDIHSPIVKIIVIVILASLLGITILIQGYKFYRRRRRYGPILDGKLD